MRADGAPTEPTAACCVRPVDAPLSPDAAEELAARYGAVADPVRLRLLSLIAASGELCSCDLLEPLGKSQPTISHHTKLLAEAGIITGEKRGRWVWWRVDDAAEPFVRHILDGMN